MNIVKALKKVKNDLLDFIVVNLQNKSDISHTHDEYAHTEHYHSYNDLTDRPSGLPSYSSDADTLDGMHASEFATAESVTELETKVGNMVTTVNGVAPDENGNVEVATSGGSSIIDGETLVLSDDFTAIIENEILIL